jgi:hypothetical protein
VEDGTTQEKVMTWSTPHLMGRTKTKEDAMKRMMMASVCAATLLLAPGNGVRAEMVAPLSWSWGESNSGNAAPDEKESHEGEEGATESRLNKPSPKLE